MTGPIYKVFLVKPKEAWYQLSQDERKKLGEKLMALTKPAGLKPTLQCWSGWSSEQWPYFGVEEYPNLEAVQKVSQIHQDIDWYRYMDSITVLGTKTEFK